MQYNGGFMPFLLSCISSLYTVPDIANLLREFKAPRQSSPLRVKSTLCIWYSVDLHLVM